MRVILYLVFTALITAVCTGLYAQSGPPQLAGRVVTRNNSSPEGITISLLGTDSAVLRSTTADKAGRYMFKRITAGSYLLRFSKIGYRTSFAGPYIMREDVAAAQVNDVILVDVNSQLQEVAVTAGKPVTEMRPGKMVLNVQSSIIAQGSSVFDVLRQSTGVRVNDDNTVSLIGHQAALITIDGKPTNLTGDDLVSVLRGIQANNVDYIELVTNGSAKYDASSSGVINIVLKKGLARGANATLTGSAGYGRYYKANAGITFNNRTDKFNIFGNYTYNANKTFHDYHTDRYVDFNDVLSNYHVDYSGIQQYFTNNFSIGTDYYLSKKQTIGFLINGLVRQEDIAKQDNLYIYNNGLHDSTIIAGSRLNRHISQLNYNLNYSGKPGNKGALLTANVNFATYRRSSAEYIDNDFLSANGVQYRSNLLLQNLSPSSINIFLSKADYSVPLSKSSKLEAGLKYDYTTSNNHLNFGPYYNGAYQSYPGFNNRFVYNENINSAYVNYGYKHNKLDLTAGLRVEQTNTRGTSNDSIVTFKRSYTNFFPHLLLAYEADKNNTLSLSFSRGIQRPSYEDINPFLYYSDLYDYRAGNPDLMPEYSNALELTYARNNTFSVTLYGQLLTDAYEFNYYEQNDTTKLNINTRKNYGRIYTTGIRLFIPVAFTGWWNAVFDADGSYQRYVTYARYGYLDKGTQDIVLKTTQSFTVTPVLSAELSGSYETPFFYGISQFKANYAVNAGLSRQLFNKKASIKLSAYDIFNTFKDRYTVLFQNLNINTVDKRESQRFTLTFTYHFGQTAVKSVKRGTGIEEEQQRTGAGSNN